ncbi:flagellin, partial [Methylobacterium sp. Leaf466]|uniref:flagellin n=1 Tax=Methylobacterium sp. Leaf466 TaxID=1736386 RepID=UPI0006FF8E09
GTINFSEITVDVNAIKLYDTNSASVQTAATAARVTAGQALVGKIDLSGGQGVRFSIALDGGAAQDIVLDRASMAAAVPDLAAVGAPDIVRGINNRIAANAVLRGHVRASLDDDGRLTFETTAAGGARSLAIDRAGVGTPGPGGNLLANGGFESDLADWTLGGNTSLVFTNGTAHSGAKGLAMGTVGGSAVLSRTLATVPGETYVIDFWLRNAGGTPNQFKVSWDSTVLASHVDVPAQPYTHYQFTVTASATTSALAFEARQDPSYWYLDDIAVTTSGADITLGFGTGAADHRTGRGTDAVAGARKGILDSLSGGTSIDTIDIGALRGTAGDAALKAAIAQVERALAEVTDAGAKLGAGKTRIDGQKAFVGSLMKANERTLGILVDADIEEESTRLKALQTQQQLGVQSLGIANSASKALLALFR